MPKKARHRKLCSVYLTKTDQENLSLLRLKLRSKHSIDAPYGSIIKALVEAYFQRLLERASQIGAEKALDEAIEDILSGLSKTALTRYSVRSIQAELEKLQEELKEETVEGGSQNG